VRYRREVAERSGYPGYASFSMAFRRATGRAPCETRNEAGICRQAPLSL
jgi:AraC-like DNA-binding protein